MYLYNHESLIIPGPNGRSLKRLGIPDRLRQLTVETVETQNSMGAIGRARAVPAGQRLVGPWPGAQDVLKTCSTLVVTFSEQCPAFEPENLCNFSQLVTVSQDMSGLQLAIAVFDLGSLGLDPSFEECFHLAACSRHS